MGNVFSFKSKTQKSVSFTSAVPVTQVIPSQPVTAEEIPKFINNGQIAFRNCELLIVNYIIIFTPLLVYLFSQHVDTFQSGGLTVKEITQKENLIPRMHIVLKRLQNMDKRHVIDNENLLKNPNVKVCFKYNIYNIWIFSFHLIKLLYTEFNLKTATPNELYNRELASIENPDRLIDAVYQVVANMKLSDSATKDKSLHQLIQILINELTVYQGLLVNLYPAFQDDKAIGNSMQLGNIIQALEKTTHHNAAFTRIRNIIREAKKEKIIGKNAYY